MWREDVRVCSSCISSVFMSPSVVRCAISICLSVSQSVCLSPAWRPICLYVLLTSRPCRTLFGYCPQPALGSRKADMKTLSFFFPTPYPCHVARKQLSSPDIMGGRAACALHPFLLCPEHDNGWVRWRTLLIPTNTSK